MRMKLDNIELIKRIDEDGRIREIRNIINLSVQGKRNIVELKIPGSEDNVFQDLGRDPLKISVEGQLVGPEIQQTLKELNAKFGSGKPLPLSSDIFPLTDISEVIIENFSATFANTAPAGGKYSMVLREHRPEKGPGETPPPGHEEEARDEVDRRIKSIRSEVESRGV